MAKSTGFDWLDWPGFASWVEHEVMFFFRVAKNMDCMYNMDKVYRIWYIYIIELRKMEKGGPFKCQISYQYRSLATFFESRFICKVGVSHAQNLLLHSLQLFQAHIFRNVIQSLSRFSFSACIPKLCERRQMKQQTSKEHPVNKLIQPNKKW